MMPRRLWLQIFLVICLCFVKKTQAQTDTVPSAADLVLQEGLKTAGEEHKNLFLIFHASWCGWCHKMDTAMNDPRCKSSFDKNYVIRRLTVMEAEDKKHLENPGAAALLNQYKGKRSGIPFWLVFSAEGKLLASSLLPEGTNSGCPASAPEVAYFVSVLKKTSKMNEQELRIIHERFRKNETASH